jgi:hypothetical protein
MGWDEQSPWLALWVVTLLWLWSEHRTRYLVREMAASYHELQDRRVVVVSVEHSLN